LNGNFASHLAMRGVALKAIQELLGHSTMDMTMRYAHLRPDIRRDAVRLLHMRAVAASPIGQDRRIWWRRRESNRIAPFAKTRSGNADLAPKHAKRLKIDCPVVYHLVPSDSASPNTRTATWRQRKLPARLGDIALTAMTAAASANAGRLFACMTAAITTSPYEVTT
jgi:hypothetical protein